MWWCGWSKAASAGLACLGCLWLSSIGVVAAEWGTDKQQILSGDIALVGEDSGTTAIFYGSRVRPITAAHLDRKTCGVNSGVAEVRAITDNAY